MKEKSAKDSLSPLHSLFCCYLTFQILFECVVDMIVILRMAC